MAETVTDTFRETVSAASAGLLVVERTGRITSDTALEYFTNTLLPAFRASYPVAAHTHTHRTRYNATRSQLSYTLKAAQFAGSLPSAGGTQAVEGTSATTTRKEASGRQIVTYSHDLTTTADASALVATLRPAGLLLLEVTDVASFPRNRLKATFQKLVGTDGSSLLDWSNMLSEVFGQPDSSSWTYTQTGKAVGMGLFPTAPVFVLNPAAVPDRLAFERVNAVECVTTWKYSLVTTTRTPVSKANLDGLVRPQSPAFYQ